MSIKTILAALFVTCVVASAHADVGRVKKVMGEAYVERSGQQIVAAQGTILESKDVLVTGPDSSISVTFVDNSRFSAGPNSRVEIETFEARVGPVLTAEERDDDIDTLGGLVFMLSSRVPARGEVVVHPDGPEFEVIDADPRRIKRLRVRVPGLAAA